MLMKLLFCEAQYLLFVDLQRLVASVFASILFYVPQAVNVQFPNVHCLVDIKWGIVEGEVYPRLKGFVESSRAVAAARYGRRAAVITRTGDDPFGTFVHQALRGYDVGEKVTLTVMRGSEKMDLEVTLGSDEALQEQQDSSTDQNGQGSNSMSEEQLRELLNELLGQGGR